MQKQTGKAEMVDLIFSIFTKVIQTEKLEITDNSNINGTRLTPSPAPSTVCGKRSIFKIWGGVVVTVSAQNWISPVKMFFGDGD